MEDSQPGETRTLWLMVAIQFFMTLSFTVLSPVMPLFLPEFGVHGEAAIDLWTGVVNGATPFVAAFASPLWGRLSDRKGRKLMLLRSMVAISIFTCLMGFSQTIWQFFALRALMGAFSRLLRHRDHAGGQPDAGPPPGLCARLAQHGAADRRADGAAAGRRSVADLAGSNRVPFFVTSAIATCVTLAAALLVREAESSPLRRRKRSATPSFRAVIAAGGLLPLFIVLVMAQLGRAVGAAGGHAVCADPGRQRAEPGDAERVRLLDDRASRTSSPRRSWASAATCWGIAGCC